MPPCARGGPENPVLQGPRCRGRHPGTWASAGGSGSAVGMPLPAWRGVCRRPVFRRHCRLRLSRRPGAGSHVPPGAAARPRWAESPGQPGPGVGLGVLVMEARGRMATGTRGPARSLCSPGLARCPGDRLIASPQEASVETRRFHGVRHASGRLGCVLVRCPAAGP